jgi:hypothetical protein
MQSLWQAGNGKHHRPKESAMTNFAATLNAGATVSLPRFTKPAFIDIRAALPDMPAQGSLLARALDTAGQVVLATVPFAVLSWIFIAY